MESVDALTVTTRAGVTAPDAGGVAGTDDSRARLVEAAGEVFAEKGYRGAGVQEIARRAGLTTGAIYSRFSGKAELLAEAIRAESGHQLDELFAAGEGPLGAAEMIRRAGSALPQRLPGRKQFLLLEAFVAARHDPEVAEVLENHVNEVRQRFGRVVEVGRRSGDLDEAVDTEALVHFCQAVALGFLLYEALGTPAPDQARWRELIDRTVDALASDPGPRAEAVTEVPAETNNHETSNQQNRVGELPASPPQGVAP